MPRDLPVSNGGLLVMFDRQYRIRDIYFPYVATVRWCRARWRMLEGARAVLWNERQQRFARMAISSPSGYTLAMTLDSALFGLLEWAAQRALPSGTMAEQLHPYTGEPLSVSPLTRSHAEYVRTVREYIDRDSQANLCPACGQTMRPSVRRSDAHVVMSEA